MQEFDDNASIQSHESMESNSGSEDKLKALISMELKHTGVYYELLSKDNLLKVDLENLCTSSQRFEVQKKKKNELLEKHYEELTKIQKCNKTEMERKLSQIKQKTEFFNELFYSAFNTYSSKVLKDTITRLNSKMETVDANLKEVETNFEFVKQEINEVLLKPKSVKESQFESVKNLLFKIAMKRPEIEIKESITKLSDEIRSLEKKKIEMLSWIVH